MWTPYQKVNEACNEILITRGVQEHGINIIFPFHNTWFDLIWENEKKGEETVADKLSVQSYILNIQINPGLLT